MPDSPSSGGPAASQTLSVAQVRAVARLARLELTDEQIERSRAELSAVLGYMDRLRSLDLASVEPMSHPNDQTNRLAEDVPGPALPTSALMNMAPDTMEPFVKVPKVIGDGGGA